MTDFDDIRPYRDDEVHEVLNRVIAEPEFLSAIAHFLFSTQSPFLLKLLRPVIRLALQLRTRRVYSVRAFQEIVESYMAKMIHKTTDGLSVSGLDRLPKNEAYLFVSNHRDIAMDPAFVNWSLFHNNMDTVRIAIGDNLLTKPFASDLMRLNKSFLVRRGETAPKKMFVALKKLSAYIHHSIVNDKASVWIAQREGRAKDGVDGTEEAIIKMFALSKPKEVAYADFVRSLNIVPVAISYEWDPCDVAKARELFHKTELGSYQKDTHEDVHSIAMGIAGYKGHVHVSFGEVLRADFDDAAAVVQEIDRQILANYRLWPSNNLAAQEQGLIFTQAPSVIAQQQAVFVERLAQCPADYRPYWVAMYANPVRATGRAH